MATPPDAARCIEVGGLGAPYPYLLGLYLGDGMLTRARRNVWKLRISLDTKYPGIIARAKSSIRRVGDRTAGEVGRAGCIEVYSYWKHWICVFPQHGPGPKHQRSISLEPWQTRLISRYPDEFLAGLIHSDGCRFINRVKGYEYSRYMFSNESADIRNMFAEACGLLGVECRPAGRRNVSVARRRSVETLDQYIGPKR